MPKMHADELDVDEALVRRLLAEQFPQWAELPLDRAEPAGTDNAIFRLGADLAVRIPRVNGSTEGGDKAHVWLPRLAPLLPLPVPWPVARGRPGAGYPWYWEVMTWIDGETAGIEALVDRVQAAADLAGFVGALQRIDPAGAPRGRGVPLAQHDESAPPGLRSSAEIRS
jgi:aminoglycoside phosphotransferase (APT) family kinase protein